MLLIDSGVLGRGVVEGIGLEMLIENQPSSPNSDSRLRAAWLLSSPKVNKGMEL